MELIPSLPVMFTFTVAALVLTLTPGPDMTLFLSRALTQGKGAGIAAMLGASSGVIIHTLLAAYGISLLIAASPIGFFVLKTVGAIYLLWLAIQAIRHGSSFSLQKGSQNSANFFSNWLTGIGINMLNPKIILFFLTFLPQFVSPQMTNPALTMIFLGFYFLAIAVVCSIFLIIAVDRLSDTLRRNPRVTRIIDWVFAGVFSAFAIRIFLTERG